MKHQNGATSMIEPVEIPKEIPPTGRTKLMAQAEHRTKMYQSTEVGHSDEETPHFKRKSVEFQKNT